MDLLPVIRPDKAQLASDIAHLIGAEAPDVSEGSSVDSEFLDLISTKLFGTPTGGTDTYRKTDRLLSELGLVYDPTWDTSESRLRGGGTVTTRTFSRVRSAISGVPRCFLVEGLEGAGDTRAVQFQWSPRRNAFAEAGPGSLVLDVTWADNAVIGWGEVVDTVPGWEAPWTAVVGRYQRLEVPRPVNVLPGGSRGKPIEISWVEFQSVIGDPGLAPNARSLSPSGWSDSGAGATARKIKSLFPVERLNIPSIVVPDASMSDPVPIDEAATEYTEELLGENAALVPTDEREAYVSVVDRKAAKIAEERAVDIAIEALKRAGWALVHDRQRNGCGYDLEFARAARVLHVEVKGVQGRQPIFNLTPKEWWRARSDPNWVVVVVTKMCSPLPNQPCTCLIERRLPQRRENRQVTECGSRD